MNTLKKVISKEPKVQIASAIIWATVIIVCSIVLKGSEYSEDILNMLILGATMQLLLLSKVSTENNTNEKGKTSEAL